MQKIIYINRENGNSEVETVYGAEFIEWLYNSPSGRYFSGPLAKPLVSKIYGLYQDSSLSRLKVMKFVKDFKINLSEFELDGPSNSKNPFHSFNSFFIRRFRPGVRPFAASASALAAFAEARYLGFQAPEKNQVFPVKGKHLTSQALLKNEKWAKVFEGGPLMIARLCPVDYHRFHYPDAGKFLDFYPVHGELHSVNPLALKVKSDIFACNERVVSILQTENFGKIAYIEVGAMCVGKIVQAHDTKQDFQKGEEKGHFLFGGSTVIILGERGAFTIDQDIQKNSAQKVETYIKLGQKIAEKMR